MAKISQVVLLLATAICISSLGSFVHCYDKAAAPDAVPAAPDAVPDAPSKYQLTIIGRVYCDTCDAGFITPVSEGVAGVNVTIVCKDREGGHMVYSVGALTDARGVYTILVTGNHSKEVCDIEIHPSTRPGCDIFGRRRSSSRIDLPIFDYEMAKPARYVVKPFGFRKKEPLEECPEVLAKMGFKF